MKSITWLGLIIIAVVVSFIGGYYASKIIGSFFPVDEPDIVGVASDTSGMDGIAARLSDSLDVAEGRIVELEQRLTESERYNIDLEQRLIDSEDNTGKLERNNQELERRLISSQNNTAELERLFSRLAEGNEKNIEGFERFELAQQKFSGFLERLQE
ncbi:MAG TPA: hypothetical protein ENH82_17085 [bacterium]|nr:hypothetical protein [bacterium]